LPANTLASVGLSLAAAASWGAADFVGGVTAKKTDALGLVVFAYPSGALLAMACALAWHENRPPVSDFRWAIAAGAFGAWALATFYHALAIGKIGINAPLAGVLTAAIPAAAGIFLLGSPKPVQLFGFVLALASIVLVSQTAGGTTGVRGAGLAALAGVGFGVFLLLLKVATTHAAFWPFVVSRCTSAAVALLICLIRRRAWVPPLQLFPAIVSAGILDSGGTLLFVLAAQRGRMDVTAVLASLYPAATVVLARVVLKEYLTRVQSLGVVAALLAIILIAA
jgi:drug/metabolite transporter (DMT)-like permease